MAENIGVGLNAFGFAEITSASPVETSRPGVYAAGVFCGPKDVPATIAEVTAAAASALVAAGGMLHEMPVPLEPAEHVIQRGDYDAPALGVFLDSHDSELTSALDFNALAEQLSRLPDVACVSLDAAPETICQAVRQYSLTSAIVGERSARGNGHHLALMEGVPVTRIALGVEDVFTHNGNTTAARTKAYDMIRMAVEAARWAAPGMSQADLPEPQAAVLEVAWLASVLLAS
jgi:heterodisulfide reductase subunit A